MIETAETTEQSRALSALPANRQADLTGDSEESEGEAPGFLTELGTVAARIRRWPLTTHLFLLALVLLYVPVLREAIQTWRTNDMYAHGFFILPLALLLVWLQRDAIAAAPVQPTRWGFVPLGLGLLMETVGYTTRFNFIAMASLIPTLMGVILLLHGSALWRLTRFAVLFLVFAAPIPGFITATPVRLVQNISTTGSASLMKLLGYPLVRTGNVVEVPGCTLEVAEVCSGFKKLTAMVAFSLLYGYMFPIKWDRRLLLFLAAFPIALAANIVRISSLIAVATAWGDHALHIAHDWAELGVLVVAFFLFLSLGKMIGCRTPKFSL